MLGQLEGDDLANAFANMTEEEREAALASMSPEVPENGAHRCMCLCRLSQRALMSQSLSSVPFLKWSVGLQERARVEAAIQAQDKRKKEGKIRRAQVFSLGPARNRGKPTLERVPSQHAK